MTNLLTLLRRPVARFAREERGTVVAEAVIVLPVLLWAYIALFAYWDSFRSINTMQKATYTISDMISREQDKKGITSGYVDGMKEVMEYLIDEDQDARLRVSSIYFSDANQRFEVHWSRSPGNQMIPLTNETLQLYKSRIPQLSPGEYEVLVEVQVDYQPKFDVGLPEETFNQFIPTRPRFMPCIAMDNISCPVS